MKKSTVLFSLLCLLFHLGQAQFSVSLEVAPSIPLSGVALPDFTNVAPDGTEEAVIATLGAGIAVTGSLYYDFNETFFGGLDATYYRSFTGGLEKYLVSGPGTITNIEFTANALYLTPVVGAKITERFYTKFGVVIGLKQEVNVTTTIENGFFPGSNPGDPLIPITGERKDRYMGTENALDLGVQTSIGYKGNISDKISWYAELQFLNMVYRPGELVNRQNFDGLPTDPTITFQKEAPLGNDEDNQELSFPLPFNGYGVGFGLTYKL